MIIDRLTIYDLETLSNLSTATFMDYDTKKVKQFVIGPFQNDLEEMMSFLRKLQRNGYWLVGFNCNAFDAQIVEVLFDKHARLSTKTGTEVANYLYEKAQYIITLPIEERYQNLIPEWEFAIPHIDLFKQKHYDGKQRSCSLKCLEFTFRLPNIETIPIHHSTQITTEQEVKDVLRYNLVDVQATYEVFKFNMFETELRLQLSEEFDLPLINASEPRMARLIFGKLLAEDMGTTFRELKDLRSYRKRVLIGDVLFPYIKFKHPTLKRIHELYQNLEFNPYKVDENNMENADDIPEKSEEGKIKFQFSFHNLKEIITALGGIHGCVEPGVFIATKDWIIRDIDVTSFYPNLAIQNNLYPEHLSEAFCTTYEKLFKMRQKIPKESPVNYVYKIILNSTYGLSKEPNNYLHDPKYTYAITVNGQMLLLMLAEMMTLMVNGCVFYQLNTDGVTMGYPADQEENVTKCMKKWEKYTKLQLEDKYYDKMVIVDVNNYLAVDKKGKVKRKGLFAYSLKPEDKELEYHKNPSFLIIPKALEAYFIHNVPISNFIRAGQDIFDFCAGVKIKKDFDLHEYALDKETGTVVKQEIDQKVVRYYITTDPQSLRKTYKNHSKKPGQQIAIEKGYNMKYFNKYEKKDIADYHINYNYYIKEARKVIDKVEPNRLNLKLF